MKIYLALFSMNRLPHPVVYLCILQVTYSLVLVLSAVPWQRECEMPLGLNGTSFLIGTKGSDCVGWKANGRSGPGWRYVRGGEIYCEKSEAHWSSWTTSLPPNCHYCHVCPRLELTPCSLLRTKFSDPAQWLPHPVSFLVDTCLWGKTLWCNDEFPLTFSGGRMRAAHIVESDLCFSFSGMVLSH